MAPVLVLAILSAVYSVVALLFLTAQVRWWNEEGLPVPGVVVVFTLVLPILYALDGVRWLLEQTISSTFEAFGAADPRRARRRA